MAEEIAPEAPSLIVRARREGTPLIDGNAVTFAFEGGVRPSLLSDLNAFGRGVERVPFEAVAPNRWAATISLRGDAYLEYLIDAGGELLVDPLNPNSITDGVGGVHSFFFMPEAERPVLSHPRAFVPAGDVREFAVENPAFLPGGARIVRLYRPPADGPHPLLVVWDGQDYFARAGLVHLVDNLVHAGRIRPIAMAFIDHGDETRAVEYSCNDATLHFLLRDVLPLARRHLHLIEESGVRGAHGVLGASMGGLMALYTAIRLPSIFGRVLSQSGAWEVPEPAVVVDLVRYLPRVELKIWMDVGLFEESLGTGGEIFRLLEANRRMHSLLRDCGYDVTYREYPGGHNYTSWSVEVVRGLEALFPPE
jgi:enterochelin esterase family protein